MGMFIPIDEAAAIRIVGTKEKLDRLLLTWRVHYGIGGSEFALLRTGAKLYFYPNKPAGEQWAIYGYTPDDAPSIIDSLSRGYRGLLA